MRRRLLLILLVAWPCITFGQVDRLFAPWNTDRTPGAAVAVIYRGQVVHKRGYGQASLEHSIPISSRTVFDVASVSKQFGAFALALLVEEGQVSLDDDVRSYVPELSDFGQTLTLRHLVHHTSGLRDWPQMLALAGRSMEDVISFDEIINMARHQRTLNFAPGERYSYSNTGYNLLALVVERVSGQSFREFTDARIFRPLGMLRTHFQDDHEEVVTERAYGYAPGIGEYRRVGNSLMALGSSSLHTTLDDLIAWVRNFDEMRVGSPAVHAMMNERGRLNGGETIAYAFGQVFGMHRGLRTVSHSGSWAGFRSALVRFPDHELTVILLSNTTGMNAPQMARRVAEVYLDTFMQPESSPPDVTRHSYVAEDYEGIYDLGDARIARIEAAPAGLTFRLPPTASLVAQPTGLDTFFVQALNVILSFVRDTNDRVTYIRTLGQEAPRQEAVPSISLEDYSGSYYSKELDATWTLSVRVDTLRAMGPRGHEVVLLPALPDVFTTDRWYMPVVRFTRDSNGNLKRFEANSARSLRVPFSR